MVNEKERAKHIYITKINIFQWWPLGKILSF